jgi:shikimate dehydrogenase
LHGYNTDAAAFLKPLNGRIESLENLRCAIIGAGGAARAVTWKLKDAGAAVSLFARNATRAKSISEDFQVRSYDLSGATLEKFDVVVNATPLGTRGAHEVETPVTSDQLRGVRLAYDLVYNPLETRFLSEAKAAGCDTVGGLEMLIAQAAEQFRLWTGETPNLKTMRDAATKALNCAS